MKIFLTGSTGYLGSNILRSIPAEYCLYKRSERVLDILHNFKPDCIIHSAAEIYDPIKMFQSNVILTQDILLYMMSHDIKMIYMGSSSEYGKTTIRMSEADKPDPYSLYAATKTCGTLLCQAVAREYNRDICIVRPFSIYGKNEPEHRLIPTLFRNITTNTKSTIIYGEHDFTHINDFIKLIDILIRADKSLTQADIINCGSGVSYTNVSVFFLLCSILKHTSELEIKETIKPQDSQTWICDTTYAKQKYDFECDIKFIDGLKEYINERNIIKTN